MVFILNAEESRFLDKVEGGHRYQDEYRHSEKLILKKLMSKNILAIKSTENNGDLVVRNYSNAPNVVRTIYFAPIKMTRRKNRIIGKATMGQNNSHSYTPDEQKDIRELVAAGYLTEYMIQLTFLSKERMFIGATKLGMCAQKKYVAELNKVISEMPVKIRIAKEIFEGKTAMSEFKLASELAVINELLSEKCVILFKARDANTNTPVRHIGLTDLGVKLLSKTLVNNREF